MSQRYIGGLIYNPPGGFSGYFDGSGDWLNLTGTNFNVGTGAFTLEGWIYMSSYQYSGIVSSWNSAATGVGFFLGVDNTGRPQFSIGNASGGSDTTITGSSALPLNTWIYLAATKAAGSGGAMTLFVNGSSVATATTTLSVDRTATVIGRYYQDVNNYYLTGYISNVRVSNIVRTIVTPTGAFTSDANTLFLSCAYPTFRDGSSNNFTITVNGNTAVSVQNPFPLTQLPNPNLGNQGNGVYTMSQYQSLRSQNLWPAIDPYWEYVTLMLHGNGTNGAQNNTFLDSSTNNFTITRNGNTTQGAFSPYGDNWSNYFDGSGDSLTVPDNAAFDFGTGAFTIETWVFPTVVNGSTTQRIYTQYQDSNNQAHFRINGTTVQFVVTASATILLNISSASGSISANQWTHLAVVRNSNTFTIYINGVSSASSTTSLTYPNYSANVLISTYDGTNEAFNGYISNLRVLKGTAQYTADFTPPTAPLTAITNTSLLTCQSNRFIDNSSNNFTITRNGDVSVQRFSPFHPTAPYAAGTIGGSGYFDGSGDFLTAPTGQTPLLLENNNFTFEAWVYRASGTGTAVMFAGQNDLATTSGSSYVFYIGGTNSDVYIGSSGFGVTSPNPTVGQWAHVAYVRTGGTFSSYLNGTRVGTNATLGTGSINNGATTYAPSVGAFANGGSSLTGYIAGARLIKGSGGYDATQSTITVPTAPPTAITNTSLLLNFTNGGIIDNAMMNDLETVGNAQISTSVSKFGGGSMSFVRSPSSYLVANNSTRLLSLGTGDWTIEAWVYMNTLPAGNGYPNSYWVVGGGPSNSNTGFDIAIGSTNLQVGLTSFASLNINTAHGMSATTWYHIAVVRSGSTLYAFINGTQLATASVSGVTVDPCLTGLAISAAEPTGATDGNFNGYIDDLRITKGYARYTANFTPQRSQWQDQ